MPVLLLALPPFMGGAALVISRLREESDSLVMRVGAKLWRKLFCREQWYLLLETAGDSGFMPDLQQCKPIYPAADRFWADPFIWPTADAHFVFVEELPFATNKGHIAVLELSRDGTLRSARKIIEQPYHMSYPFVFQWEEVLYMLPESGENSTVELYRCEEFPHRWVLDRVLFSDLHTADATLVEHDGLWWLFMTQATAGQSINEHLYLYWADSPLGPYTLHPRCPVKSGLRGSRPAGALFHRDGCLYRPAQDCSRVYGEAVILHRVEELTKTRFREVEAGRIASAGHAEARRVHTLNVGDGVRVMDALRWIAK